MDNQRKRLLYRSRHRGMQETDRLLGGFAERHVAELNEEQLARFGALLEESDNDLFNWITGKVPPPSQFDHDVMALLKRFAAAT